MPVYRNAEEMVDRAWARARGNTAGIRGTGTTPFQERVNQAADLRSYKGVTLTLPDDGGFEIGELDGRSVLIPDLETCSSLLDKTIYE